MIMPGTVTPIHSMRRRAGMGAIDPTAALSAAAAASDAYKGAGGGGGGGLPASGGGSGGVNVPVTTQVTTAVSPVFNISAGNSGGGGVTQSGSTSQTTTPTATNLMNQPQQGQPGAYPAPYDPYSSPGATSPYGMPGSGYPTSDSSYQYDSSNPLYPQTASAGASGGLKTVLMIAAVAAVAYLLINSKGSKVPATRRTAPRKVRKSKKVVVVE